MPATSENTSRFEQMSPLQRGAILTATALVLIALLLLLGEAAVQIRERIRHGSFWGIDQTIRIDPESGLRVLVPGHFGPIIVNSEGFRSPEIDREKPPGRLRIAFLGGSTTFCAEVSSNDATWPARVFAAMHQHWPTFDLEYINAGVPGYTVANMQRLLETRIAAFQPDIIVLYEATNDLSANTFQMAVDDGIVKAHADEEQGWLARHSLLALLVSKNLEVMRQERLADVTTGKLNPDFNRLDDEFRHDYGSLIAASQKIAKIVVTVSFSSRIRTDETDAQRRAAAETSLFYMPYMRVADILTGFAHYNAIIRELAAADGTLLVGGENSIPADAEHFADSVHFTDAGAVVQAKRVFDAIIASPEVQALVRDTEERVGRD